MSLCQEGCRTNPFGDYLAMRFAKFALSLLVIAVGTVSPAVAGAITNITWGSAQNITGDSDVSLNGTLVYAYNFGPISVGAITVNGVSFEEFGVTDNLSSVSVGAVTVSESGGYLRGSGFYDSASSPFSSLSSNYQHLLRYAVTANVPDTITLQLGGLTIGQTYDFQWWSNNSTTDAGWKDTTATATNSVTLFSNSGFLNSPFNPVEGGLGQYAIGRFTATSTTHSINFNGTTGLPLINAFQLRSISSEVPEPSMLVIAASGLAFGGFSKLRRRKQS